MPNIVTHLISLLALFMALAACGGGGGGTAGITVSGVVQAASATVADSDVNDPLASYASNDEPDTAQVVGNPVTIGGYVNAPGTGPAGRSQQAGDELDAFRVTLQSGQAIELLIADSNAADLDLYLFDNNIALVAGSAGVTGRESLIVPESGDFYVVVYAFSNASTYILSIGQAIPSTATSSLDVVNDFVIGEAIVKERPQASKSISALAAVSTPTTSPRAHLTRFNISPAGPSGINITAAAVSQTDSRPALLRPFISLEKWQTLAEIKALRKRPDIAYAEPNYIRHATAIPNDNRYPEQWNYPLVNLPQAWDINTGNGSIVAVIDTGVLLAHPDLQGQLLPGYDFISDPDNALDGDGIDDDPNDVGDDAVGGSSFHGTHVAGIVAATSNNTIGVAGIAWNSKIMPLRVLGKDGGTDYDIQQAVLFAAGLPNDSPTVPAQRADVINLSLGGSGYSQASQDVLNQARAAGVIIIAAAGNDNSIVPFYPAAYAGVVSVSAVDRNKNRAPYSNYGSTVDVTAPGGNMDLQNSDGVLSTHANDTSGSIVMGYSFQQGTSMASPHVAGVAALMKSFSPTLTPEQFDGLLVNGQLTDDIGTTGRDDFYGYGLVNAYKAVIAVSDITLNPLLVAIPASLNIGASTTSVELELSNIGTGTLTINPTTDITDTASWLHVTPKSIDANGLGIYEVNIDRTSLTDGNYTAEISITADTQVLTVPVAMLVNNTVTSADAGRQYILLINATTDVTTHEVAVDVVNGEYPYSFGAVVPGQYYLVSGSDNNNDGLLCDIGESCGTYLSFTQPIMLNVQGNLSGLDFVTGYLDLLTASSTSSFAARPYARKIGK